MSSDGGSTNSAGIHTELVLAKWSDRFFAWLAWLIDFIIVSTVLWAIFSAAALPFWLSGMPDRWFGQAGDSLSWAATSLAFFAYWIYFESTTGQSLGKMALRIRTTDLSGNKADIRNIAIQSFGKSFLLPLDVILGWIFTSDKRQRMFSRAGNTIVIKIKGDQGVSGPDVRYAKD
ncbi:MAG: RDD family protein [Nitrososphaera sp.]